MIINGRTLAFYREKADLTQEQLASHLGNTRVTIGTWEGKDRVTVTDEQLKKIETLLNVNTDDLTRVTSDDILDHPVIRSLVAQADYITNRVKTLEAENKELRGRLGQ